jgi:hypothetical protein
MDLAQDCLADILRASDRKVTIDEIIKKTCEYYNIRLSDLMAQALPRDRAAPAGGHVPVQAADHAVSARDRAQVRRARSHHDPARRAQDRGTDPGRQPDRRGCSRSCAACWRPERATVTPADNLTVAPAAILIDAPARSRGNSAKTLVLAGGLATVGFPRSVGEGMKLSIERAALLKRRRPGAVGRRAAQHHPDPRQRADRGRGRHGLSAPPISISRWSTRSPRRSNAPGPPRSMAVTLHEIVRKLPDGALVSSDRRCAPPGG